MLCQCSVCLSHTLSLSKILGLGEHGPSPNIFPDCGHCILSATFTSLWWFCFPCSVLYPLSILLWLTDVICSIIVRFQCNLLCLKVVQISMSLCCVLQGQMTVNGGLTVPASPRSHLQRPFSPSTYPPPPSLSPSITAMQHVRTTGEYCSYSVI